MSDVSIWNLILGLGLSLIVFAALAIFMGKHSDIYDDDDGLDLITIVCVIVSMCVLALFALVSIAVMFIIFIAYVITTWGVPVVCILSIVVGIGIMSLSSIDGIKKDKIAKGVISLIGIAMTVLPCAYLLGELMRGEL